MANQFGFDLGEVYRDIETIKGARLQNKGAQTQNKLSALNLTEAERVAKERPGKEAALNDARNLAAGGNEEAKRKLLVLDPKGGPAFIKAIDGMDDRKKAQVKEKIDEMGNMTAAVLNAAPEKRPMLYSQLRSMMPPESQAAMPEQYNESFLTLSIAKLRSMEDSLEAPTVKTEGDQDKTYNNMGQLVSQAENPTRALARNKAANGGTGASGGKTPEGGIEATSERLMYKQAVELMGGLMNEITGEVTMLDPSVRPKVQGIATEATLIFKSGGVTRTQALSMAARKFGVNVEQLEAEQGQKDPLGIR